MISPSHFHPMLVHFPIALVVFGFVAEITTLYFKKDAFLSGIGFYLLIFATLSAIVAWLTGNFFTAEMEGSAGDAKETHELFALITVSLLIITSLFSIYLRFKKKEHSILKWPFLTLYGLAAIAVSITGFYGGTLVYNYMPL